METKQKSAPLLNTAARGAIVRAFSDAFDSAENTGSVLTQVCNVAHKYIGDGTLTDDDTSAIVRGIVEHRRWPKDQVPARSSEVRTILAAHATLPRAIAAFRERVRVCNWHQAVKLAREIRNAKGNITKAVTAAVSASKRGSQSKGSTPQGRTAAALKAWFKVAKGERRDTILKVAAMLGLKLGVKLEA
jgi:hypothetical protein